MILTGPEILSAVQRGDILIEPFDLCQLEPNSYAFRLESKLLAGRNEFDAKSQPMLEPIVIPQEGYVLEPDVLYLGLTCERTASDIYAQMINGNRSTGALGIWVHVSAPLAHSGSAIRWTLEIRTIKPVRVYPHMIFGKIVFLQTLGRAARYGEDKSLRPKYTDDDITASQLYREFYSDFNRD